MILTETYFRKISGLMLPKESQALEQTLTEAQSVLKQAHSKGVELECIVEVREGTVYAFVIFLFRLKSQKFKKKVFFLFLCLLDFKIQIIYLFLFRLGAVWCRITRV